MLQLKNISKQYITGELVQNALKDVSLNFRANEFVAVLGPSGSGKTTLLNIVGGLDRYDSGDLIINGVSTRKYNDRDWDSYRNHSIGFVFQSYNLIPHQSILANVELALTISGISRQERKERAARVLEQVGLGDQLHKKPNQMSGGQMQRVAIARALVNDPDILLADEPTGALDTETSLQVMQLLKEVAKDQLVIMVTHNPELANQYANRIVELRDGAIINDTRPYPIDDDKAAEHRNFGKTSMSFLTALSLSLNNLKTKKARTALTAFAGSIGIIGIALILSLSNGVNHYIDTVQRDTLSTYPITIESESINIGSLMSTMMLQNAPDRDKEDRTQVYSNNITSSMLALLSQQMQNNDLATFYAHIRETGAFDPFVSEIKLGYDLDLNIFSADTEDDVIQVNPNNLLSENQSNGSAIGSSMMSSLGGSNDAFEEMLGNRELLEAQYDVLAGRFPEEGAYDEVVLLVDENNEISDFMLYTIGLMDQAEYRAIVDALNRGEEVEEPEQAVFTYDEILATRFKLVLNTDYFVYNEEQGFWEDKREDQAFMKTLVDNGLELKIVGILRPNPDVSATSLSGTIAYTSDLTRYVIQTINDSQIVKDQKSDETINVLTNQPFDMEDYTENLTMEQAQAFIQSLPQEQQVQLMQISMNMSESDFLDMVGSIMMQGVDNRASFSGNLQSFGVVDLEKPSVISLFPKSFESKNEIIRLIDEYNTMQIDAGNDDLSITYTDIAGLMMSSISTIINMISYVLIGFVSISLIVSSIMIGIITYISVLERTKEIGILRSIGASKRNVKSIFNAETLIVGLLSGLFGIAVTILLLIPANAIIFALTDVANIAILPWQGALILVIISIILSMIAGLIPASKAAKQDPVTALRTE